MIPRKAWTHVVDQGDVAQPNAASVFPPRSPLVTCALISTERPGFSELPLVTPAGCDDYIGKSRIDKCFGLPTAAHL